MKLSDKLSKVSEDITVRMLDNGFVVEASGRNHDDDWANAKLIVSTVDEVYALIGEAAEMEKDQ